MSILQYILGKNSITILALGYEAIVAFLLYYFVTNPYSFLSILGLIAATILLHPIESIILNFLAKRFTFYEQLKKEDL